MRIFRGAKRAIAPAPSPPVTGERAPEAWLPSELLSDLAAVERILPEWRALANSFARAPIDAPDWLFAVARHYLADYGVRVLTWRDEHGQLAGIAPFSLIADRPTVRPVKQLRLWGTAGPRLRGLADLVARDKDRERILDGLAHWLRTDREWQVIHINRPQVGSTTPWRLRAEAIQAGWAYVPYSNLRSTTFQVDLPQSAPEWARHLSPKNRRSLHARRRRFELARGGTLVGAVDESEIGEVLDALEVLLARRWHEREVYFRNELRFRGFLHDAIPRLVRADAAWVSVARDASGVVAGLISLSQNRTAMSALMVASPDAEHREFSLGAQIHDVGIYEAVRRGCHTYDLLWAGTYKQRFWRAQPRELHAAFIGRGVVGRIAAQALAHRERAVGARTKPSPRVRWRAAARSGSAATTAADAVEDNDADDGHVPEDR